MSDDSIEINPNTPHNKDKAKSRAVIMGVFFVILIGFCFVAYDSFSTRKEAKIEGTKKEGEISVHKLSVNDENLDPFRGFVNDLQGEERRTRAERDELERKQAEEARRLLEEQNKRTGKSLNSFQGLLTSGDSLYTNDYKGDGKRKPIQLPEANSTSKESTTKLKSSAPKNLADEELRTLELERKKKLLELYFAALDADTQVDIKNDSLRGNSRSATSSPLSQVEQMLKDRQNSLASSQDADFMANLKSYTDAQFAQLRQDIGAATGGGSGESLSIDQNKSNNKKDFSKFDPESPDDLYISTKANEYTDLTLKTGTFIPATLITKANSDLPGHVLGQISQNMYDTKTGRNLLIPRGSKVLGMYNENIAFGQERLQIVWYKVILPNTVEVNIGNMNGYDTAGTSGSHDLVDNHYGRLLAGVALTTLFATATSLAQDDNSSSQFQTNAERAKEESLIAATENISEVGSKFTDKQLEVQPTLILRKGLHFNIFATKNLVFETAYKK